MRSHMKRHILILLSATLMASCGSKHNSQNQETTWEKPSEKPQELERPTPDSEIPSDILSPPLLNQESKTILWQGPKLNPGDKSFLRISQQGKELIVEGLKISFDTFDTQDLYKSLNNRSDLEKISFHCEVFELQKALTLPGVDVEIKARDLIINKEGSINLTPLSKNTIPSFHEDPMKRNGKRGKDGAILTLNIENLQFPTQRKRALFVLRGANGQPAGYGKDGVNGESVEDLGGGLVQVIRFIRGEPILVEGSYETPTKGSMPTPPGKPGVGGKGGTLISNITIPSSLVDLSGGLAGKEAPPVSQGNHGKPHPFYVINERNQKKERRFPNPIKVKGPKADYLEAEKGEVHLLEKESWVSQGYLEFSQRYIQHLYKNNHIQDAKLINEKVLKTCDELMENDQYQFECQKSIKDGYTLLSQLDYYGNEASWTPSLSLESNYHIFNEEIDRSFRILFLSYWSLNKANKLEERIQGIEGQQIEIQEGIHQTEKQFNQLELLIPRIKTQLENIKQEEAYFETQLLKIEKEILKQAQRNVEERNKIPFYKKALKSLAAISRVVPVGQPALGAAATSISTIVNSFDQESPTSYLLENLPDQLKNLTPSKIDSSIKSWETLKREVNYSEYKRIFSLSPENSEFTKEEIRKIKQSFLKKVKDFASPIATETIKQIASLKKAQVGRSEIDKEIFRIRKAHPLFKSITQSLQTLVIKRATLNRHITDTHNELLELSSTLTQSYLKLGELSEAKLDLAKGNDRRLRKTLNAIEQEQQDRLDYYLYLFRKAYQYRVLKSYPSQLSSKSIIDKIKTLASKSEEPRLSSSEFHSLKEAYSAQISKVVETIARDYDRHYSSQMTFNLTQEQLSALNKGHEIYLNLGEDHLLGGVEGQSIRINDIKIEDLDIEYMNQESNESDFGQAILSFQTLGVSRLESKDETYTFTHEDKHTWGAKIDLLNKTFSPIKPSSSDNSLFQVITGSPVNSLLFTRPGGLGHVKIVLNSQTKNNELVILKYAQVQISYDYQELN